MKLVAQKVSAADWERHCAAHAHRIAFFETWVPEYERIDFAILVADVDTSRPVGYITCRELDRESVYLKHGGAFPPFKDTLFSRKAYLLALAELKGYARITTLVENTNRVYLKMALSVGFKPIGIRNFKGLVLVELFLGEE